MGEEKKGGFGGKKGFKSGEFEAQNLTARAEGLMT
jgi:hypothetical protein